MAISHQSGCHLTRLDPLALVGQCITKGYDHILQLYVVWIGYQRSHICNTICSPAVNYSETFYVDNQPTYDSMALVKPVGDVPIDCHGVRFFVCIEVVQIVDDCM